VVKNTFILPNVNFWTAAYRRYTLYSAQTPWRWIIMKRNAKRDITEVHVPIYSQAVPREQRSPVFDRKGLLPRGTPVSHFDRQLLDWQLLFSLAGPSRS